LNTQQYIIRLCGTAGRDGGDPNCAAGGNPAQICQYSLPCTTPPPCTHYAILQTPSSPPTDPCANVGGPWQYINSENTLEGITCTTNAGEMCYTKSRTGPRQAVLSIQCGQPGFVNSPSEEQAEGEGDCIYNINLYSCSMCLYPDICSNSNNPPPSGSSKQGLSGGSIFLILFFVGLFVYFVAGALVLKYKFMKEGLDIIPNRDLWASIPGLVKDGCLFTYAAIIKVVGKASGGTSAYDTMK